ncbi:MAG: chemotaxis protein CheB [Bernardetiaceae bacterium]|nr:chemotaxis protein CheB [Bernardetiaceae bacterium]
MPKFELSTKYKAIVIGGSAGSFQPITQILAALPKEFPVPLFLCLHRLKHVRHGFVEALSIKSNKDVIEPADKESIRKDKVYLAPANYHMALELGHFISLSTEELINNSRPSIDITFESAAYAYRDKVIGILLSGANKDGAAGMEAIHAKNGMTIVQDPSKSVINAMPNAALARTKVDYILSVEEIIEFLLELDKKYRI